MADDLDGPVGPIDYPALRQIRDLIGSEEPLADSVMFDDAANPTELIVTFTAGSDRPGRLEITWWQRGGYRFHYTESNGVDLRFDRHPKSGAPDTHFHPPPDAGPATASVLAGANRPQVVTRAVLARWREAVVGDTDLADINAEP